MISSSSLGKECGRQDLSFAPLPDVGLVGQIGSGDDCFGSPKIQGLSNWLVTETVNVSESTGGPFSIIKEGIPVKPPIVNSLHYTAMWMKAAKPSSLNLKL